MSELYNKKELKKQSRDFRIISSRTLTSDFQMFGDNLKRLLYYIDNNEIIKKYIESCIDKNDNFKIEDDVNLVCCNSDHIFNNYIDEKQEVSYIYQVLEYIVKNNKDCRAYTMAYSYSNKYQDKLKGFCDNVVEPFINHIENNYERIFIEMGYDEDTKFEITINGGQVNIAKDDATINATQVNSNEINRLVKNNIEGIQEELSKSPIKKGRIKAFVEALKNKLPSIGQTIEVSAAITELITFVQQYINIK